MLKKIIRQLFDRRRESYILELQEAHDESQSFVGRFLLREEIEKEKSRRSPEQLNRMTHSL